MRWYTRRIAAGVALVAVVVAAAIASTDAVKLPPKLPATAVRVKLAKIKDACYRSATDCWTGTHKGSELWCISHPWSQVRQNEPCMRLLCEYFPDSFKNHNWCGRPSRPQPVRPEPGNPDPKPEPPTPPEDPDPPTPEPPKPDPVPPTPPPVVPKPPNRPDCRRAIKPLPASTTLEKLRMIRGACEHTSRDCWTGDHRHSELWCITHPWSQIDHNDDCIAILIKLFPRHFKCGGDDDPVPIEQHDIINNNVVDPRPGRKPCLVPRKLSLSAQREVKADCEAHLPSCFDGEGNVGFTCVHEGWSHIPDGSRCMETINRMFASKLPTAALAIVYAACVDTVHSCRNLEGDDYWTCVQANIKEAAGQCGQVVMEVTCRVTIVESFEEKKEHEFKQEVKHGEPGCTPALASTRAPDASTVTESPGETQVYHEVPIQPGQTVVTPIQT